MPYSKPGNVTKRIFSDTADREHYGKHTPLVTLIANTIETLHSQGHVSSFPPSRPLGDSFMANHTKFN